MDRRSRYVLRHDIVGAAIAAAVSCGGVANARSAVQRDVQGYASATCLVNQSLKYLKDQGDAWASAIVQRSHGGIAAFKKVADVVTTEMAGGHVAVVHVDDDPAHDKEVPVLYCAEIIDTPRVAAAIDKATKRLARFYRRSKR